MVREMIGRDVGVVQVRPKLMRTGWVTGRDRGLKPGRMVSLLELIHGKSRK